MDGHIAATLPLLYCRYSLWGEGMDLTRLVALLSSLLLLAGCSGLGYRGSAVLEGLAPECRAIFIEMQQRIDRESVADPRVWPLRDFPYLGSDRLHGELAKEVGDDSERRDALRQRLFALGAQARGVALDQLRHGFNAVERQLIERCINTKAQHDSARPEFFARIIEQASVPDEYVTWQRVLGLYPLTAPFVLHRLRVWQQRWLEVFQEPAENDVERTYIPYRGDVAPLPAVTIAAWVDRAVANNALGLPELSAEALDRLFRQFAPQWRIGQGVGARSPRSDYLGRPYWLESGMPSVDVDDPVSYRQVSYSRFAGRWLLQLNYVIWFSERLATTRPDIFAGRLDGLIWRVTLGAQGRVLSYDAIHTCGCYHMLFPVVGQWSLKALDPDIEQPLIVPVESGISGAMAVSLKASLHHIFAVSPVERMPVNVRLPIRYRLTPYASLLRLPAGKAVRSLFDAKGLVPGTERLERWLLWPMGVPSAGAMRVLGRHAVSFTGRRHFDDPTLLEEFFVFPAK